MWLFQGALGVNKPAARVAPGLDQVRNGTDKAFWHAVVLRGGSESLTILWAGSAEVNQVGDARVMSGFFTHSLHRSDISRAQPLYSGFPLSYRVMGVTGFWGAAHDEP